MNCPECGTQMEMKHHKMWDYSGECEFDSMTCPKCKCIMRWDK